MFQSQLGFWTEIASVFAIIVITIILAAVALLLLALNNGSIGDINLSGGIGLDMDKVKVIFILIGTLGIISVITIGTFATMCRVTV